MNDVQLFHNIVLDLNSLDIIYLTLLLDSMILQLADIYDCTADGVKGQNKPLFDLCVLTG